MWLNRSELEALLSDENDRAEYKSSLANREDIKEVICAFANDLPDHRKPGVIFVGFNNDRTCANLFITEEMERLVAGFRLEGNILPPPTLSVQRLRLASCDLLVVQVLPSDAPPVRLRGVAWVKVGSTKQRATSEEERRLTERVRWNNLPFDQRPVTGAVLDELDLNLFQREYLQQAIAPEVLDANERPLEQQLSSLRLATLQGQPTYAGVLCLGKSPRRWVPGDYIQFVRFEGTQLTDPIKDQKEIDGPLPDMMRRLDELLELHVQIPTQITGSVIEHRSPDYPIEALRQLARNAVMHRSYEGTNAPVRLYWFSDRIEIHSPGGPFGQVNRDNFGNPGVTDYRNPQLAEAMRVLGYVQRFGAGIPIARRELEKNGNPPLSFIIESSFIVVLLRGRI